VPDRKEADIIVDGTIYRSGGRVQFNARIFDTIKNTTVYADELYLNDRPGVMSAGGKLLGLGIDNFLD
jgi:TolB-like protein